MTNELTSILGWRLAKAVEVSLNQVLASSGDMVDLSRANRNNNYWNMTLLQDPIFNPEYVTFVLDGSFHSSDSFLKRGQENYEFPLMPIMVGDPNQVKVQFFISEVALNMAMLTLFENRGLLKGHRVSSTYVKTFIPNFEEVFGNHSDLFLLVEAMSSPKVKISHDVSSFTAEATVRLLNPFNEDFEAIYMVLKIDAEIQFELLQDFTLIANIVDSKLEVTEFETYF